MAQNIEMNWFNGSEYEQIYPVTNRVGYFGGNINLCNITTPIKGKTYFWNENGEAVLTLETMGYTEGSLTIQKDCIRMGNRNIKGLADPVDEQDAVNKNYFDLTALKSEVSSFTVTNSTTYFEPTSIKTLVFGVVAFAKNSAYHIVFGYALHGSSYDSMIDGNTITTDIQINESNIKSSYAISNQTSVKCLFIGK